MLRFNKIGYLPPGIHQITFPELRKSVLVQGDDLANDWNEPWRRYLVDNLEKLIQPLWELGIEEIYIDGSFCSVKGKPDDIDGYYSLPIPPYIESIQDANIKHNETLLYLYEFLEKLNAQSEQSVWNVWSNGRVNSYGKMKSEMWHHYRCELFPHCWGVYAGRFDPDGRILKFDEFFQKDRDGIERGLIRLLKGE